MKEKGGVVDKRNDNYSSISGNILASRNVSRIVSPRISTDFAASNFTDFDFQFGMN